MRIDPFWKPATPPFVVVGPDAIAEVVQLMDLADAISQLSTETAEKVDPQGVSERISDLLGEYADRFGDIVRENEGKWLTDDDIPSLQRFAGSPPLLFFYRTPDDGHTESVVACFEVRGV